MKSKFIWPPFTHLSTFEGSIPVERSIGCYYYDKKGKKYLDAFSSWWVNLHGHSHPYIVKKVSVQAAKNAHSVFSGFTHSGAEELAQRILKKAGGKLSRAFFSDDGSTSVEVAIKMAIQFWRNRGEGRTNFICFHNAYHGDTFGSMSVGERNVFTSAFASLLFKVYRIPLPQEKNIEAVKKKLSRLIKRHKPAAFIYEPLVQGAGGMNIYAPEFLDQILKICKKENVLCIADEVMTGFGRTGTFFAGEQMKVQPDLMCLSKGLTGGFMPLGMTLCSEKIFTAFYKREKEKTFFHGHSYTGNPIACAAALGSLDLMEKKTTWRKIRMIAEMHAMRVPLLASHPLLTRVAFCGTILALEFKTVEKGSYLHPIAEEITRWFLKRGVIVRPLGNVFYLMPPYCITKREILFLYQLIAEFLDSKLYFLKTASIR